MTPSGSFKDHIRQIEDLEGHLRRTKWVILKALGVKLTERMKARIGHRDMMGSTHFFPWAEWSPWTKDKHDTLDNAGIENGYLLVSGEMRDSLEYVASGDELVVGSNSDVMLWQELGTEKIPPRSVLGAVFERNLEWIKRSIARAYFAAWRGASVEREIND